MQLYVIRHAIAADRDVAKWPDDADRPLTRRGKERFRRAAKGLSRVIEPASVVLSSPYVRAWDTALILNQEAGWPDPFQCPELTADDPTSLLAAINAFDEAGSVAIVGHEPYLSRFVATLLSPGWGPWLEFKKGGVAVLDRIEGSDPVRYELVSLLSPKVLRSLAKG
jgi:phosphohistidine phosphatase